MHVVLILIGSLISFLLGSASVVLGAGLAFGIILWFVLGVITALLGITLMMFQKNQAEKTDRQLA